jgi:UDP-2,3-diacylglucosamine pyrophosphatase LpxH
MNSKHIHKLLSNLYFGAPKHQIDEKDKIIIFSDLHLGNGSGQDDFTNNSQHFIQIMREYYIENNYKLVLNGDIEELYKFPLKSIVKKWAEVFEIFDHFDRREKLFKIVGNHDDELNYNQYPALNEKIQQSIRFKYKNENIFLFHGHQTTSFFSNFHKINTYALRYIANPLRIKNGTYSIDSIKRFKTEKRAYDFASRKKIIAIIGHTHRPLFESMAKRDYLMYRIENMLRKYPKADLKRRRKIERNIKNFRSELRHLNNKKNHQHLLSGLYNDKILVPCLFNSGAVIGKRGMTGLEIENGNISLIYWFHSDRSQRYLNYKGVDCEQLGDSKLHKAILKKESLDYIFTRIKLLS